MSPSKTGKVKVVIKAEPATEIFLIDHEFRLREKGVGEVKAEVEPGLYKIKYRAGSRIEEVHEEIPASSTIVHITGPEVAFNSPAPLSSSRTTHEYHEEAASRLSREVHHHAGDGSQIFVFARAWTEPRGGTRLPPVPQRHHAAKGLTLRHADGSLLLDIGRVSDVAPATAADPWACANISVAPGSYRLRVDTPRWGALEQTIIATEGWQTQIFLLQDDYSAGPEPEYRADLAEASVLLARIGKGFDPARDDLRLVELCRQALANGRAVLSIDEVERIAKKHTRPMLGVYGGLALLARGSSHRELLPTLKALKEVLGRHPDVDALDLALSGRSSRVVDFPVPPMLMASWSIVVSKAAKRPELVPRDSVASRIAPYIWGSGPWLTWLADSVESATRTAPSANLFDALMSVAELSRQLRLDPTAVGELSDIEAALLAAVDAAASTGPPLEVEQRARRGLVPQPAGDVALGYAPSQDAADLAAAPAQGGDPAEQDAAAELSAALGLPPSALHTTADELSRKLSAM